MSPKDLDKIAHRLISEKIDAGEIVQMHWAVTELINSQGGIAGDGEPFYSLCAREHVYRTVKKAVDKYDAPKSDDDVQMILDGFQHVREAYSFERDGERQLIPVYLATSDELLSRCDEFSKIWRGVRDHELELRQYVADREGGERVAANQ